MPQNYESVKIVNLIAGEDLRNNYGALLTFENDSNVAKVVRTSGSTASKAVAVGILAEEPRGDVSTDGHTVAVATVAGGGKITVRAGAAITAGQLVLADTTAGRVAGVSNLSGMSADTTAIGIALESATDGNYFQVLLQPITSATD